MATFNVDDMRKRLDETIQSQRRNMAEVSIAAGLSKSYLHSIIQREQVPSVEKLERICKELGVSMLWVMYGLEVPDGAEEVFESVVLPVDP